MTSHSQHGQDRWVLKTVFPGKRDGVFLDIGAHDGERISNTLALEEAGWTGVAVDPFPHNFANRSCALITAAISEQPGQLDFVWPGSGHGGAVQSLSTYNQPLCAGKPIVAVQAITPCQLLQQSGLGHIDYVSLDVEGHELAILRAWPFHQCRPGCWTIEHNMEEPRRSLVRHLMQGHGYRLAAHLGWDDAFVRADLSGQTIPGECGPGQLSHSGKFGDLAFAGAAIRAEGARTLFVYDDETSTGLRFTEAAADFIRPLFEAQQWCDQLIWSPHPVRSVMTGFRDWGRDRHSIVAQHLATVGRSDLALAEVPWFVADPLPEAELLVSWTPRWHDGDCFNWHDLLQRFAGRAAFIGLAQDHAVFSQRHGAIPWRPVADALEMARLIAGSKVLASVPTLANAIACGLRHPTVLVASTWCNADWGRPECATVWAGSTLTPQRLHALLASAPQP